MRFGNVLLLINVFDISTALSYVNKSEAARMNQWTPIGKILPISSGSSRIMGNHEITLINFNI